jgi:hypothetical protein
MSGVKCPGFTSEYNHKIITFVHRSRQDPVRGSWREVRICCSENSCTIGDLMAFGFVLQTSGMCGDHRHSMDGLNALILKCGRKWTTHQTEARFISLSTQPGICGFVHRFLF